MSKQSPAAPAGGHRGEGHRSVSCASPRKLNLVAQIDPRQARRAPALAELTFSKRRIANDVKKVLQAAIANAENNHQLDVDRL